MLAPGIRQHAGSPLLGFFVEIFSRNGEISAKGWPCSQPAEEAYPFQFFVDLIFEYDWLKSHENAILDLKNLGSRYHVHASVN